MRKFGATVLHDFFVDRIVFCEDLSSLTRRVNSKAREGGGGVHGVRQTQVRGGNAVNMAEALARLGTKTYLVTHSDASCMALLKKGFEGLPVELSVKSLEPGLTVALETREKGKKLNVMLGHSGGAGDFPPSLLDEHDWRAIESSEVVCSVNWAANRRGTELLQEVRIHRRGKPLFLDPADFRDRPADYLALLKQIKRTGVVDWLSLNEFEAQATARLLGLTRASARATCRGLARELEIRVDVHTESGSHTSVGGQTWSHDVRRVDPHVLTGAGDVWDAASVHYFLAGAEDHRRIELADRAAGIYVRSDAAEGPTEGELLL
ncbi:MAG TPA: carbohydrate kinase family protein [Nitrososphaerales archaeon]|nr:carbohydrate kinase family protein [Nitrososphaerales archaeon]